jgi:hypothetical protein
MRMQGSLLMVCGTASKRHHLAGIKEVVRLFWEKAREAARQHIISDLKEEGWSENDPFPKDEHHYVKMGLF